MLELSGSEVGDRRVGWQWENTYAQLPQALYELVKPTEARAPEVVVWNEPLAEALGLDLHALSANSAARLFSGQDLPIGSQPLAQAYAGHQFGHFTMLGDGRAILLGEHRTPTGQLVDIQFKGSGRTPFSRGGDGRAALGPMLREYVISEALAALGIPTTRSLAVVTTGEPAYRNTVQRGAILTRVAASHIRVGTFQYLAARRDGETLRLLADYTIARHDPQLVDEPDKYLQFLKAVIRRQAALIAQWQLVGFIHGVMNTDNMAVSGESIDFGPCAFMNVYRQDTVFSSIDQSGRYAYGNQPSIAQWNLARFAETLLPLLNADMEQAVTVATEALNAYPGLFKQYWLSGMRGKLGLRLSKDEDLALVESLLDWMEKAQADYTNTFRDLSEDKLTDCIYREASFQAWHGQWQARLAHERGTRAEVLSLMQSVNPVVIPRNHLVEEALAAAEQANDLSVLHRLLSSLALPFDSQNCPAQYRLPPADESRYRTFCGT